MQQKSDEEWNMTIRTSKQQETDITCETCGGVAVSSPFGPPEERVCTRCGLVLYVDDNANSVSTLTISDFSPVKNNETHMKENTEETVVEKALLRLAAQGLLRCSKVTTISANSPNVLVIENHGVEQIDIHLVFDTSGFLIDVKAFTDRH
jgi:hypothetical protein